MSIFSSKDDPINRFQKDLLRAVKTGDADGVQALLTTSLDIPMPILGKALEKAVADDQIRIVDILVKKGVPVRYLGGGTIRDIVHGERKEMFRLLAENGVDFALHAPGENSDGGAYKQKFRYMKKDMECDRLREEFDALKKQLTEQGAVSGPEPEPGPDAKKDQKLHL